MPPPTPPPSANPSALHLKLLPNLFFVCQLPITAPHEKLLSLLTGPSDKFLSVTRTSEELSVVGEEGAISTVDDDEDVELKWRCIKILGPMEFELTGILASFTAPLKEAGVPVFAVSTWNTDYVLVPKEQAGVAVRALKGDGWTFVDDT